MNERCAGGVIRAIQEWARACEGPCTDGVEVRFCERAHPVVHGEAGTADLRIPTVVSHPKITGALQNKSSRDRLKSAENRLHKPQRKCLSQAWLVVQTLLYPPTLRRDESCLEDDQADAGKIRCRDHRLACFLTPFDLLESLLQHKIMSSARPIRERNRTVRRMPEAQP